ncbi:MAG: hypothetical protein AAGJ83_08360 [Planctomycetota bacterium]
MKKHTKLLRRRAGMPGDGSNRRYDRYEESDEFSRACRIEYVPRAAQPRAELQAGTRISEAVIQ